MVVLVVSSDFFRSHEAARKRLSAANGGLFTIALKISAYYRPLRGYLQLTMYSSTGFFQAGSGRRDGLHFSRTSRVCAYESIRRLNYLRGGCLIESVHTNGAFMCIFSLSLSYFFTQFFI